jgi:hypothetical protein
MFYYFNPRPMKRFVILTIALAASLTSFSQVISSRATYQPMTFEELAQPLLMYQQAYNRAEEQCYGFYEKALEAIENEKYNVAESYLKQCIRINNKFRGNIIDNDELYELLSECQAAINIQSRTKQTARPTQFKQHSSSITQKTCPEGWLTRMCDGSIYYTPNENDNCRITNITTTQEATVIEFEYTSRGCGTHWLFDPDAYTYIRSRETGAIFAMLRTEGTPLPPSWYTFTKAGETLKFKVYFKAMPREVLIKGIDIFLTENEQLQFKMPWVAL